MKALILNGAQNLVLKEIEDPGNPSPGQVRIKVGAVGICGSDVHYFEHGRIGDFIVHSPMILGHEAAGTVESVGQGVETLAPGDRVAMEPGIPCGECKVCRMDRYNLCQDVKFWATPPVNGAITEYVLHPANYTYRLPASLTVEDGALIEPLAVAVHACLRGKVGAGNSVAISGAGTIGCMTLLVARAFGAHTIIISDLIPERLARAESLGATSVINVSETSFVDEVRRITGGTGVDIGIDSSGNPCVPQDLIRTSAPAGRIVLVGMGKQPIEINTIGAMVNEVDISTVFRYANTYQAAIDLVSRGDIEISSLITNRFPMEQAIEAFKFAQNPKPETCKIMITSS